MAGVLGSAEQQTLQGESDRRDESGGSKIGVMDNIDRNGSHAHVSVGEERSRGSAESLGADGGNSGSGKMVDGGGGGGGGSGDEAPNPKTSPAAVVKPLGERTSSISRGQERDAEHMRRGLELAARGLGHTRPNPAVGCVILDKDGDVVGEGFHPRAGEPHAEVWAIRQAGEKAKGGTAYVTLEPCNHFGRTPPCTTALIESGVSRVVAGMVDPDPRTAGSGLRRLADAGIDVSVGIEGAACQALNSAFVHRISEKACYGILHCCLAGPDWSELKDTRQEPDLTVSPKAYSYDEYDAIVVEGRYGVSKLSSCLRALPPNATRVIVVMCKDGVDNELASTLGSELWADSPERTVVVVPEATSTDGPPGPVRTSLASRGITFISYTVPLATCQGKASEGVAAAAVEAAVAAVARELYGRGLLSAAWEVGPAIAMRALDEGHIQRAVVSRWKGDTANGHSLDETALKSCIGSEGEQEQDAIVRSLIRLTGREGLRLRGDRVFEWGANVNSGRRGLFTEVLLPLRAVQRSSSLG